MGEEPRATVLVGDVLDQLAMFDDGSVDCVVTSPPYWGLRDYGVPGQIGLEPTPDLFVARIVQVFREVRRVLAPHGTCWVNMGDSYAANRSYQVTDNKHTAVGNDMAMTVPPGLKPKDLCGIPWRIALALQADGWYLRADIIWAKPNPMPESVTDRPTKAHEYVFLLTKRPRYFYDQEAVRETATARPQNRFTPVGEQPSAEARAMVGGQNPTCQGGTFTGRNLRTVWEIPTHPYPEAHFATYPPALVERCVKAGCPKQVCRTCGKPQERIVEASGGTIGESWHNHDGDLGRGQRGGDDGTNVAAAGWRSYQRHDRGFTDCGHNNYRPGVVLDPFLGSGTTIVVALRNHLDGIGIELNPEYAELARRRIGRWWEEPVREREEQIAGQLSFEG